MIETTRAVSYLLEQGSLAADVVVDGEVTVIDVTRRNRNFKVICDRGPCFLLKQEGDESGSATVVLTPAAG